MSWNCILMVVMCRARLGLSGLGPVEKMCRALLRAQAWVRLGLGLSRSLQGNNMLIKYLREVDASCPFPLCLWSYIVVVPVNEIIIA